MLLKSLSKGRDISITLFTGMAGFESLRDVWDEVVSGMTNRHFFHLWEWYYCCFKCLETDPDDLIFFLFEREGTPIAIFPLKFTNIPFRGIQLKALAFPSHNHLLLCDIICHDGATDLPLIQMLSQYLRNLGKSWDIIQLPHLLEDAYAIQVIRQQPISRFLLRHECRCDHIDSTGEYGSYISGLSKNFKRSLKRAKQYLDSLPNVQFAFTKSGPEMEEKLHEFMEVEASGWKGSRGTGTAIKLNPSLRCFYETLANLLSASGQVSINTLTVDGKCIAAQYCLMVRDTIYILKIGYDEGFKRYAPGNLLLALLLRRSMEDKTIRSVNLITDAEWHKDWKPKAYNQFMLCHFNASPAGLMGFALMKSASVFKKQYQTHIKPRLSPQIQEWIRTRIH